MAKKLQHENSTSPIQYGVMSEKTVQRREMEDFSRRTGKIAGLPADKRADHNRYVNPDGSETRDPGPRAFRPGPIPDITRAPVKRKATRGPKRSSR